MLKLMIEGALQSMWSTFESEPVIALPRASVVSDDTEIVAEGRPHADDNSPQLQPHSSSLALVQDFAGAFSEPPNTLRSKKTLSGESPAPYSLNLTKMDVIEGANPERVVLLIVYNHGEWFWP